jgi:predicted RNA binding protein YcfA (HicA-like mRNA interferase family)
MTAFPSITGSRLIRTLRRFGFEVKGSHHFLRHLDGRCTVAPVHQGENIGRGLLAQILRDCDLTKEEGQKKLWVIWGGEETASEFLQRSSQTFSIIEIFSKG